MPGQIPIKRGHIFRVSHILQDVFQLVNPQEPNNITHSRGVEGCNRQRVATVMAMNSLLGCETARRLTGADPEETGKNTHTGFRRFRRVRPGDRLRLGNGW